MKTQKYKQCLLEKKIYNGIEGTISWIPEEFAKVGRCVDLKEKFSYGDKWTNNWIVKEVYNTKEEKDILIQQVEHKVHRKTTDI